MENKKTCQICDKTIPKSGIDRKNGTTLNNRWKTLCRKCTDHKYYMEKFQRIAKYLQV